MVHGRRREEWNHTALIWATLMNAHRDKKKKPSPFSPLDVHPFAGELRKAEPVVPADEVDGFDVMKRAFVGE